MILFSIPVHEQPDVIVNQVENFTWFNPDCKIVLHVSGWMSKADVKEMHNKLSRYSHVFINDTRLWSGHMDGTQLKMHVVNCLYAQRNNIDYDHFCINASNDMFVKSGLQDHISSYDTGNLFKNEQQQVQKDWDELKHAKNDPLLQKIMKKHELQSIYSSQVEGSFYKKEIMDTMVKWIMEDGYYEIPGIYAHGTHRLNNRLARNIIYYIIKPTIKGMLYVKEEIYFPTLCQNLFSTILYYNYCYINWENGLKITKEEIDLIRSGDTDQLPYKKFIPYQEKPPLFCVKRVDRVLSDPIRQYITGLQS